MIHLINRELTIFPDNQDFQHAICCQLNIGSSELKSLLEINKSFNYVVNEIYKRNMLKILKNYSNKDTPLNCKILSKRNKFGATFPLIYDVVSKIQRSIIRSINALGIPCPNAHVPYKDISVFNCMIEDLNLQKIWPFIFGEVDAPGKPAENASAEEIRFWMNESLNTNLLQQITYLGLSGKKLTTIPKEIGLFTGLQILELFSNQIKELPKGIFESLNNLHLLSFHNNKIKRLPQNAFNGLWKLEKLTLCSNKIKEISLNAFDGLKSLARLNLVCNEIKEVAQPTFISLQALTKLYLNNNLISELPNGLFDGLKNLTSLDLCENPIIELFPDTFSGLPNLERFWIDDSVKKSLSPKMLEIAENTNY